MRFVFRRFLTTTEVKILFLIEREITKAQQRPVDSKREGNQGQGVVRILVVHKRGVPFMMSPGSYQLAMGDSFVRVDIILRGKRRFKC